MKKYILPVCAVLLVLICIIATLPAPEPEHCAICDSIPYHAPALVNLATGEVGELTVYEPHPFKAGELWEYQQGGTFSFLTVAGVTGYRDTARWEFHISIPIEQNEYEEKYFCKSCREKLQPFSQTGFVLADLRLPSEPEIYFIQNNCEIKLENYLIHMEWNESNQYEVTVIGTIDSSVFSDHPIDYE
ncbi:MAG: hypothetical protein IJ307_02585 [Bacteroidales bacterium]|nr:hypothetical protein [Bacteroidales bacterium]